MFGTFAIANYLRHFRNSKFLGRRVRRMLGDFGVPIAILLMVAVDQLIPQVSWTGSGSEGQLVVSRS